MHAAVDEALYADSFTDPGGHVWEIARTLPEGPGLVRRGSGPGEPHAGAASRREPVRAVPWRESGKPAKLARMVPIS